jgi:hypothetical protein
MPTKVKVRVSSVDHTTVTSAKGFELNYVVLKGFDEGANKGFKKQFFATKKDGTPTVNAQTADQLAPNDWVELTLDDTSYQNVQTLRKINAPDGATAPDQVSYQEKTSSRSTGGGKSPKAFRTVPQLNREVALDHAIKMVIAKLTTQKNLITMAVKLEDYLVNGVGVPDPKIQSETMPPPGNETPSDAPDPDSHPGPAVDDDDIPF